MILVQGAVGQADPQGSVPGKGWRLEQWHQGHRYMNPWEKLLQPEQTRIFLHLLSGKLNISKALLILDNSE